ncbi:MAG: hypothetical protein U0X92_15375 [Anaerolineales bacterium]
MNLKSIWSALIEGFSPLGFSEMEKTANELGVKDGWVTLLWASWLFDSEPFSTETFMRVRPYGLARVIEARFASAAKQGLLSVHSVTEYQRTEKGKQVVEQIVRSAEETLVELQPVSTADLQKILDYAMRLVEATFDMPEPPSKFALTSYYENLYSNQNVPLLRLILHHVGTLDQYRGAAHIASWELHNIKGYEWSALTSIWRNEANTLDALHEDMGASVFTRDEILEALRDLIERGWIEEETDTFRTTADGGKIRQEAEDETDRLFFIPWSCLNESELEELASLAGQLRDGLKNPS